MRLPSPPVATRDIARLRRATTEFSRLVRGVSGEAEILREGEAVLASLIAQDDWLLDAYAEARTERYQQYLLYCDAEERFSIVSFVWGPGQETPIHNHTVWGLVGVLRGAEQSQRYALVDGKLIPTGMEELLPVGSVDAVSPRVGDIHKVRNAFNDRDSISIHVYGGNIGAVRRAVYRTDGDEKPFISGYSNTSLPNLWDRSAESADAA
ncbi:MAG: hypothetical protein WDM89_06970 [Rhizomicrobium sp.]